MIKFKKVVIIILLIILCCGCNSKKKDNRENDSMLSKEYDSSYIEVIPDNAKDYIDAASGDLLLSSKDIKNYNEEIRKKSNSFYDIDSMNSLTREEILSYIEKYQLPELPKYDGELEITASIEKEILDNRNISAIISSDAISKGLIVRRTNLKSFPTDYHFFDEREGVFDSLQETELSVNTPLRILHVSSDGKWNFVVTETYAGWVKEEDIVICSDDEWDYFINNSSFAVITTAVLDISDTILDMGVKLPFVKTTPEGYELILPARDERGKLTKKSIVVSRDKAHIGYLPYTVRNIYIEAFKYEGIPYSWGGMDYGVDCSSYVSNVLKTFGIILPRNTSSQKISAGKIIDLSNKNIPEKREVLKENFPSLLYQPGHVMIYLGRRDGHDYIIHASGSKMKVTYEELTETSSYLKNIDRQILIF